MYVPWDPKCVILNSHI
ncbi:BnaA10g10990D [Brassica napus]|uniref:BnaA10g10990D protein n=1 Tax=Brassica napus TaxID=3708 RepID=A0A078H2A3_BRANA|nr:BnaA10g10990D [Brassica napus]